MRADVMSWLTRDEDTVDKVGVDLDPLGNATRHDRGRRRREHELQQTNCDNFI